MPSAPLDWPVERFTQALDRREVNRKALLKWIQSNLQAGIDYGQIHFVGKDKCRLVADGEADIASLKKLVAEIMRRQSP
jgi:hypothetical protein